MLRISPVKVVAALAAVILAVGGMFFASEARQATVDLMSMIRLNKPAAGAPSAQPAEAGAKASGVRVIPIGIEARPGAASASRPGGR